MKLSDATKIMVGASETAKVYLGSEAVWPAVGGSGNTNTLNPLDYYSADLVLSDVNMSASRIYIDNGNYVARAVNAVAAGKKYFEILIHAAIPQGYQGYSIGLSTAEVGAYLNEKVGETGPGWSVTWDSYYNGRIFPGGGGNGAIPAFGTNADVISVAYDSVTGHLWFAKNGVWMTGDPALGTTPLITDVSGAVKAAVSIPCFSGNDGVTGFTINFGAVAFAYVPPNGFSG
jgi:hypothetical protein